MVATTKYRNIHRFNVNIEKDRFNDFKDLCWEERKSISDKINELIIETVEKKALGDQTPINVSYGKEQEKPLQQQPQQLTLNDWVVKISEMDNLQEIGAIHGYHKRIMEKCKVRMNQIRNLRL